MKKKAKLLSMLYFTITYMLIFTATAILYRNYEFLYYTFVIFLLILLIIWYHKKFELSTSVAFGLTLICALHIFGGNIIINQTRLYELWLIWGIFRYDNFVHLISSAIATMIAYSLLSPFIDPKIRQHNLAFSVLLVLIAMGIGAANEVLELTAVAWLNAAEQVGDYMNNALDLVFNLVGSVVACIILTYYNKKHIIK